MASPSLPVAITRGEKKWTVTYARGEEVAVEEGATHANRGLVLTRVRAVWDGVSFLYFWNEVEHHLSGTSMEMKVTVLFFFCVPVLSCSRTTLRLRFYSHLHTHLCLSAPQTETTKRWWRSVFFLSSTTKHSSQVYFTRRPHIADRATTTHESQRCPAWLVPPLW